jgi:GNAT superfamily N-acetyltransferase
VAKLRWLLVEPNARGFGIGNQLVGEYAPFARAADYRKIALGTNSVLVVAGHLDREEGSKLIRQERFGKSLVGEPWELALSRQATKLIAKRPSNE